jgi:heat-inducible transcriptional repressor
MLDDRKASILRAVVARYIETAQPVGSTQVVESSDVGVSPATVRSEMTLLEREGYLVQPHTSAGRIPTEKGYRFFVDHLPGSGDLGPAQAREVRAFFSHAHGELEQMLKDTSRLLSRLTATTAVVVGDTADWAAVRSVQLVELSPRVVLAVAVLSDGGVLKRAVDLGDDLSDDVVADASARLAAALVGRAVNDPTDAVPSGSAPVDHLVGSAAIAIRSAAEEERRKVYVEGSSHIAGAFETVSTLQEVLGILEQQLTVVTMLEDVINRGLRVAIGSETGVAPLAECSVVVAPFTVGDEPAGTIGVLGPTRMNYAATLAAVAMVSQRLSLTLSEGER